MLQKDCIKRRFYNSKITYKKNATIQYAMQETLLKLLKEHVSIRINNSLGTLLELGCGNGDFSKAIIKSYLFESYYAIDLVDFSSAFVDSNITFIQGDFEHLDSILPNALRFDCILSNAALQWGNQHTLLPFLSKKLKKGGILLFSTFGKSNFKELKTLFNLSLDYLDLQDYSELLCDCKILDSFECVQNLQFENPLNVFKHLKNTGVNALKSHFALTKAHLNLYEKRFQNVLTYHTLFVCAKKY
ncbi:methyltransferase domain-containing protein [Helicobacter turcicus]|uniref:Methyltransferase domain-containing protein n=1 Tax=Helicobacter turcicus TaxID=2867412 RepID=A0ABS7JNR7_9HELI|nr:methyltransferase domain-containing protein [Helicobacter turcicus]MBX7491049.1 methyltransferase domain-containing protein [Helicobacter turcicus]MBX7546310.1 methyltransferase domain-containing protein [Helicobacter turcicus]